MATVMITDNLLKSVRERISLMADAEVREACPDLHKEYAIDASYLFKLGQYGEKHLYLAELIPADWIVIHKHSFIYLEDTDHEGKTQRLGRVEFKGLTDGRSRPTTGYWSQGESILTEAMLKAHPEELGYQETKQRLKDLRLERDIRARFAVVSKQVCDFLERCRSLNEAVKVMPNIRLYLTKDFTTRLDKPMPKKETSNRREDELFAGIDADMLAATAVTAKITGVI